MGFLAKIGLSIGLFFSSIFGLFHHVQDPTVLQHIGDTLAYDIKTGFYAKDKQSVYYTDISGDSFLVSYADASTFTVVAPTADPNSKYPTMPSTSDSCGTGCYYDAQDKNYKYYLGKMVQGNSQSSTTTNITIGYSGIQGFSGPGLYTLQSGKVFYDGTLIPSADQTFVLIKNKDGKITGYAKDKTHVYNAYYGTVIQGADPATFVVLNYWYAKDKNQVYSYNLAVVMDGGYSVGTPIVGADSGTFQLISGQSTYDAQDKNHKYLQGQIVQ